MFRRIYLDRQITNKLFKKNDVDSKQRFKSLPKNKIFKKYESSLKKFYYSSDILIPKLLVGSRVYYQTGKGVNSVKITDSMVGFKLREFNIYRKNTQKKNK